MADTGAGSANRKRKELTKEQKKVQRDSDRARAKTRVSLSRLFNKWRELGDLKRFKTDPELFLFVLDQYVICNMYLFLKYIARSGFTVHGGITLGHGGHYCNTTGF